jgi:hypothetical protein
MSKDDAKYKDFVDDKASTFIAKIEPLVECSKFILGDKLTVIDFWVGALYCDKICNKDKNNAKHDACWAEVLKKYPNFKRFGEDFKKENADWLMKRSPLEF